MSRAVSGWILAALATACAHTGSAVDADGVYNAILRDDAAYVRTRVQAGILTPDQSIAVPGYHEGTPLITVAARSASLDVMRYLIAAGADVNARTPVSETALMLASFFHDEEGDKNAASRVRHEKAVRLLVAAGAEIENEAYHYTPLSYAAYQGHDDTVAFLIARGARVDGDAENGGTYIPTPLMMAAIEGHYATALRLLRAGANAAIRVHGGHTAAEFAEKYRHRALARLLRCAESLPPGEFTLRCEQAAAREIREAEAAASPR